jgi:NAD dependent epimerase/dehydratase family enzyme
VHNQTALIAGSSGLIGTALTETLRQRGAEVRRLVRREVRYADEYPWDPYDDEFDERPLKGVDVVVNLSGANVGEKRWTEQRKRILHDSRIVTTQGLAQRMSTVGSREPRVPDRVYPVWNPGLAG